MRKITSIQITVFLITLGIIIVSAVCTAAFIFGSLDSPEFKGIILILTTIFSIYAYAFLVYRLVFLKLMPLKEGVIPENSKEEFIYHFYLMFFLILFYPIMRSGFFPVPLMRVIYLILGAKLGENSYSSGIILDPLFVKVGSNSIIGQYALLIPHVIEGQKVAHYPITIGDNVTIGAHSVVMSNVLIEDNAIVSVGAVVTKNSHIRKGEVWGGVPAKKIR